MLGRLFNLRAVMWYAYTSINKLYLSPQSSLIQKNVLTSVGLWLVPAFGYFMLAVCGEVWIVLPILAFRNVVGIIMKEWIQQNDQTFSDDEMYNIYSYNQKQQIRSSFPSNCVDTAHLYINKSWVLFQMLLNVFGLFLLILLRYCMYRASF